MFYSQPESDHGANAGLGLARDKLEPIYKKYARSGLTYSDLWTLAGVAAIQEIGGPKIAWRPGRQDGVGPQNCTPDGRLPDGDKDQDHVRKIFYRMGFNDQVRLSLFPSSSIIIIIFINTFLIHVGNRRPPRHSRCW